MAEVAAAICTRVNWELASSGVTGVLLSKQTLQDGRTGWDLPIAAVAGADVETLNRDRLFPDGIRILGALAMPLPVVIPPLGRVSFWYGRLSGPPDQLAEGWMWGDVPSRVATDLNELPMGPCATYLYQRLDDEPNLLSPYWYE